MPEIESSVRSSPRPPALRAELERIAGLESRMERVSGLCHLSRLCIRTPVRAMEFIEMAHAEVEDEPRASMCDALRSEIVDAYVAIAIDEGLLLSNVRLLNPLRWALRCASRIGDAAQRMDQLRQVAEAQIERDLDHSKTLSAMRRTLEIMHGGEEETDEALRTIAHVEQMARRRKRRRAN